MRATNCTESQSKGARGKTIALKPQADSERARKLEGTAYFGKEEKGKP